MQRALLQSLRNQPRVFCGVRPVVALRSRITQPVFAGVRMNSSKPAANEANGEENKSSEGVEGQNEAKDKSPEQIEVEELKQKLFQKDKDLAEMKNLYSKAVADFRNLQESTKKEMQKAKDFALQKFAKDLLESIDNFNLALNAVKEDTIKENAEVKNLYEGVNMTKDVFEKTLAKHGIHKIDPMGQVFDPNQHEATFEIPQPDKEPGTVFHVQQSGYTLNSRVLRPAKVGIVKDTNEN
ncbi:Piso0_004681 [Millerozyma farinosa CBS 7064]|uniref:GrpE protein homolog n=1 Tax=Pichia sorbitophila (strain ATCC MYA-4447 / BCRC 22081 / CBS 7064 / NBRC 10061 / NRRL Y-12695) TaxID=559304 RepID=G8Y648_PICSO|nr:Piso0_004681 [Millerozyma farinosa CBS 7064]CCE85109.1 Piso0_004681 [Millerozyma farinosa CBS 7064]